MPKWLESVFEWRIMGAADVVPGCFCGKRLLLFSVYDRFD